MSPPPQTTISDLPDDLLAHVLRFATGEARRDDAPTAPVALSAWRLGTVSSAFRRAFVKNLCSLSLSQAANARRMAAMDWCPLATCSSLRRLDIGPDSDLTDAHLMRLFRVLSSQGIHLRQADITLDRQVTHATPLHLVACFGPYITHFALRVAWNRRARRIRSEPLVVYHVNEHANEDHLDPPLFQLPPAQAPAAQQLPVVHQLPPLPPPHPSPPQFLPNPALHGPNFANEVAQQMIHVFDGIPALAASAAFANLEELMANDAPNGPLQLLQEAHQNIQNSPHLQLLHQQYIQDEAGHNGPNAAPPTLDEPMLDANQEDEPQAAEHNNPQQGQPVVVVGSPQEQMQVVDNALPNIFPPMEAEPGPGAGVVAAALAAVGAPALPTPPAPPALPALAVPAGQEPPQALGTPQVHALVHMDPNANGFAQIAPLVAPRTSPLSLALTDDVLATILARLPYLREVRIDRARHVMNPGILPLASCVHMESMILSGNHFINNVALQKVMSYMTKLRVLRLRDMPQIGDPTIAAVCNGPVSKSLEYLELQNIGKVTDPAIRQLVNSCDNLKTVRISDCARITCEAASHLSCALRLEDIYFKPQIDFHLTNRTTVHFSCAASTLQSLELVGCKNLSLDGILALGNLPGLRKLHLRGLGHVSQDVMRQLGNFAKLDDVLLEGHMHLTDLGVKVLIAQRGHRFLHLGIIDQTKNLTDEALESIMTWCVSLRSLEVHGHFKNGAIDRLAECMPSTTLTVHSNVEPRRNKAGHGGLWDSIPESDNFDNYYW